MSDHDPHDLDVAFRELQRDVNVVAHPRGAALAVRTARRRRATAGFVAAALATAVGGLAASHLHARADDQALLPAGRPPALTQVQPFDASVVNTATRGWESGWQQVRASKVPRPEKSPCPRLLGRHLDRGNVTPTAGRYAFRTADESMVVNLLQPTREGVATPTVIEDAARSIARCMQASLGHGSTWDNGRVQSWEVSGGGHEVGQFWLAHASDHAALAWSAGSAGPVPDEVDRRFAMALVTALENGVFHYVPEPSARSAESDAPYVVVGLSDDEIAQAIGSWASHWNPSDISTTSDELPCSPHWSSEAPAAGGTNAGNGYQEFATFNTVQGAQDAFDKLQRSFRACSEAFYDVAPAVTGPDGAESFAAVGPEAVWVVHLRATTGVIAIPAASSPLPAQVTTSVTELMLAKIAARERGQTTPAG